VALGLLVIACGPGPPAVTFGAWQPPILATPEIAALEQQMAALVNADRRGDGLPPLSYDPRLADIGRAHSLDMRDHGFFAHESPVTGLLEDRIDRAGYLALEMRENLAQAGDIQRAEANLLASPGHRANIMAPTVTHIGVGIVRGGSGDPRVLTITQVFTRPALLDTPSQAVDKVVGLLNGARTRAGLAPMAAHPVLEQLADEHIAAVPNGVPAAAVADIGDQVSAALNQRQGHGLGGILIAAQGMFNGDEFQIPSATTNPATAHYGIAATTGADQRGRPRVKVLVLLGQVRSRPAR